MARTLLQTMLISSNTMSSWNSKKEHDSAPSYYQELMQFNITPNMLNFFMLGLCILLHQNFQSLWAGVWNSDTSKQGGPLKCYLTPSKFQRQPWYISTFTVLHPPEVFQALPYWPSRICLSTRGQREAMQLSIYSCVGTLNQSLQSLFWRRLFSQAASKLILSSGVKWGKCPSGSQNPFTLIWAKSFK